MYMDAFLRVSNAQAFTAVAVSTDAIDLGNVSPKRDISRGEPIGFAFSVGVAASATDVKLEVIQATDNALTAGIIVLAVQTRLAADLPAGALLFMPFNVPEPVAGALRFIGIRATPAGGAATVTLTAWLTAQSLFSAIAKPYARGYTGPTG